MKIPTRQTAQVKTVSADYNLYGSEFVFVNITTASITVNLFPVSAQGELVRIYVSPNTSTTRTITLTSAYTFNGTASPYVITSPTNSYIDLIFDTVANNWKVYPLGAPGTATTILSNIYYVSPSGSNVTGDGSIIKPYQTANFALTKLLAAGPYTAAAPAVVFAFPGSYTENAVLPMRDNTYLIGMSTDRNATIFNGASVDMIGTNSGVQNITVVNTTGTGFACQMFLPSNATLQNCSFTSSGAYAAISVQVPQGVTLIDGCSLTCATATKISLLGSLAYPNTGSLIVRNCSSILTIAADPTSPTLANFTSIGQENWRFSQSAMLAAITSSAPSRYAIGIVPQVYPQCLSRYSPAAQNIPNNSFQPIQWTTLSPELPNTMPNLVYTSADGRFTWNGTTPIYLQITYQLTWAINGAGSRRAAIYAPGQLPDTPAESWIGGTPGWPCGQNGTGIIKLDSGEYFRIDVYQNSGGTLAINANNIVILQIMFS